MIAFVIPLMLISSILGALGVLNFKFASKTATSNPFHLASNKYFILALTLYGFSFIAMVASLKLTDLSIVYPLFALSYIWVALLSSKVLKEKIHTHNWIGFLIIIGGIALTIIK